MKKRIAIVLMLCMGFGLSPCLGLEQKPSAENNDSAVSSFVESSDTVANSDTKESNDAIENGAKKLPPLLPTVQAAKPYQCRKNEYDRYQ